MNQLPKWVLTNPLPAVNDLESLTTIEMVSRLYAAMQTLIDEVNAHVAQVNKTTGENAAALKKELEEFEHKFTCISNDLVRMVRGIEKNLPVMVSEAVAEEMKTAVIGMVYDPETESLSLKLGGETE